ncbi:MAG: methionine--tRNA ligase [bacterium]|nr:methionine--tRNA ligase [bacterium]
MPHPFSLSTAIAYVNGPPHIGHALEFVEADCLARYHRMIGDEVYFLTGTDEHGSKIVQTAEKLGIGVRELVDMNAEKFRTMMAQYRISYDQFIRTSDQKIHWPAVEKIWKKMVEKGDIYKDEYKGLYCVGCEEYKVEKDLVDGKCPSHDKAPEEVEQVNYFFRLSKYSDQIAEILKSQQVKILPNFRANEIIALCERGLEDVSFSRPNEQLSWGVPVPGDESQTMYVWCDALTNYISALDYANEGELFRKFWPVDCHVIGKDILRFHAGVWIGMLLSAEIPLPKAELVHGWIHFEGGRMSKSMGNVVDPVDLAQHYGVDASRYYLLAEIPVGQDGNFSYELFENKINADLANNLGNFVNRVLSMTERYLNDVVPPHKQDIPSEVDDLWQDYHEAFVEYDHQKAAQAMIGLVNLGNKLIDDAKPWAMAKNENQSEDLRQVLRRLLKMVLHLAFMLSPFCPEKAEQIAASFDLDDQLDATGLEKLQQNTLLDQVKQVKKTNVVLFARIEPEKSKVHQTS